MNNYDSRHLRLLDLISLNRWAEMDTEDLYELKVLVACKYVRVDMRVGRIPSIHLNPEGHHYHHRLSAMAARRRPNSASSCVKESAQSYSSG